MRVQVSWTDSWTLILVTTGRASFWSAPIQKSRTLAILVPSVTRLKMSLAK